MDSYVRRNPLEHLRQWRHHKALQNWHCCAHPAVTHCPVSGEAGQRQLRPWSLMALGAQEPFVRWRTLGCRSGPGQSAPAGLQRFGKRSAVQGPVGFLACDCGHPSAPQGLSWPAAQNQQPVITHSASCSGRLFQVLIPVRIGRLILHQSGQILSADQFCVAAP